MELFYHTKAQRNCIPLQSGAVDRKIYFFRAKAQRRKEILVPSEAVDGKIYFFLAKAQKGFETKA